MKRDLMYDEFYFICVRNVYFFTRYFILINKSIFFLTHTLYFFECLGIAAPVNILAFTLFFYFSNFLKRLFLPYIPNLLPFHSWKGVTVLPSEICWPPNWSAPP